MLHFKLMKDVVQTYQHYYVDRDYEQLDLFRLLKSEFAIHKVVYPGSYVHVSPSFVFPDVTYIDSDKKARAFFNNDGQLRALVQIRKNYQAEPKLTFIGADYRDVQTDLVERFDLLISQYAGFVSEACKAYLRVGGSLLVNNSHGDAGLAALDPDYKLIATLHKAEGRYRISYAALESYFIPSGDKITRTYLHDLGRGVGYTKTAPLYLFRRLA